MVSIAYPMCHHIDYETDDGCAGVLIWIGDIFGEQLKTPDCGNITAAQIQTEATRKRSAVELSKRDAAWVKH